MWNGERIINPLLAIPSKKPSLKALCRRLEILRHYLFRHGMKIESVLLIKLRRLERDEGKAIDEVIWFMNEFFNFFLFLSIFILPYYSFPKNWRTSCASDFIKIKNTKQQFCIETKKRSYQFY